jgi:hypothetical protein
MTVVRAETPRHIHEARRLFEEYGATLPPELWFENYQLIADKDEKQLSLDGFVRVSNNSGEEYEDAQVRLVVGTIEAIHQRSPERILHLHDRRN